jgi:hypothetical protein
MEQASTKENVAGESGVKVLSYLSSVGLEEPARPRFAPGGKYRDYIQMGVRGQLGYCELGIDTL